MSLTPSAVRRFDYGRMLADFQPGHVYRHPFELTVDGGLVASYMAGFIDASPLWSSAPFAAALGLTGRPAPAHLLLNLGLSFSVHDISQQAIAHLAYVRVAFPKPLPLGGTVRAASKVIAAKATSAGDKGVVHVQTVLVDERGERVLDFERKALVRGGTLSERPVVPRAVGQTGAAFMGRTADLSIDRQMVERAGAPRFQPALWGAYEDFTPGDTIVHANGRTVGETEHMQLAAICRNSHPLHWDSVYSEANSFKGVRVVYGGLVLAWTLTQASIDLGGHLLWELDWRDGAHPAPVLAGDTLFAATRVLATRPRGDDCGEVDLRMVGIKNERPEALIAAGADLFKAERDKDKSERISNKVVELTRTILVGRRR